MTVTFIQEDGTPRTTDVKSAEEIEGMIVMTLVNGERIARPRGAIINVSQP